LLTYSVKEREEKKKRKIGDTLKVSTLRATIGLLVIGASKQQPTID
jgi:hypothetical protein